MRGLREALYGHFLTKKLIFMIIAIARDCSIRACSQMKTTENKLALGEVD